MRVLVLFCGQGAVEAEILTRNPTAEITSLDWDPKSAATHITDIKEFVQTDLFLLSPGYFDIMWASPPNSESSREENIPIQNLEQTDELAAATLACLLWLKPKYWFIENPAGMLRWRPLMRPLSPYLQQVSYCKYGGHARKDTCIWTNSDTGNLEQCRRESYCDQKQSTGRHGTKTQGDSSRGMPSSGAKKSVPHIPQQLLQRLLEGLPEESSGQGYGPQRQ